MNFNADPHPRVRSACCNAIGQMSTEFAPVFVKVFHTKLTPGLLMLMQDSANPRVRDHSGATLVNFSEDCPKNILLTDLLNIMNRLEEVLTAKLHKMVEKRNKLVLEQILSTIASVADMAQEKFVEYYEFFPDGAPRDGPQTPDFYASMLRKGERAKKGKRKVTSTTTSADDGCSPSPLVLLIKFESLE